MPYYGVTYAGAGTVHTTDDLNEAIKVARGLSKELPDHRVSVVDLRDGRATKSAFLNGRLARTA